LFAEGGEIAGRVETEQPCFACMLGGDDRRTLYAMTAPTSVAAVVATAPQGRVVGARVATPGAGRP
jgi:sugar lactone lactonase YvrE